MKKNKIVITGGAGFVGTNLINLLLKKTKYKIISIDNYSSGSKKNHIRNNRVNYIKADTIKHFSDSKEYQEYQFHLSFRRIC
tara:strand:+ start:208 stop:453 length:246 start_codon:yes stop_codon:yes gene_type:complete